MTSRNRLSVLLISLVALAPLSPLGAGVVISEIYYHPPASAGRELDFIEFHNPDDQPVAMGGWQITGGIRFTFEEGTVIEPDGYLVVCKDCALVETWMGGSPGPMQETIRAPSTTPASWWSSWTRSMPWSTR